MDDKLFVLWEENRQKGISRFVLAYGFTATVITLVLLLIAKMFLIIGTALMITIIASMGIVGILFGLMVWNRYERQYLQRVSDNTKKQG